MVDEQIIAMRVARQRQQLTVNPLFPELLEGLFTTHSMTAQQGRKSIRKAKPSLLHGPFEKHKMSLRHSRNKAITFAIRNPRVAARQQFLAGQNPTNLGVNAYKVSERPNSSGFSEFSRIPYCTLREGFLISQPGLSPPLVRKNGRPTKKTYLGQGSRRIRSSTRRRGSCESLGLAPLACRLFILVIWWSNLYRAGISNVMKT